MSTAKAPAAPSDRICEKRLWIINDMPCTRRQAGLNTCTCTNNTTNKLSFLVTPKSMAVLHNFSK